uniref:Uncharacterized protein n=1 Tax=Peronospora matthiolae TaxID=2874970 RepID=A0AAV1VMR4_9STRA
MHQQGSQKVIRSGRGYHWHDEVRAVEAVRARRGCKQVRTCFEVALKMPKESEKKVPKMSLSGFQRDDEVVEKVN